MTSPPEPIKVRCPNCQHFYADWARASLDLSAEDFDDDDLDQASSSTCPECGYRIRHDQMIVGADGTFVLDYVIESASSEADQS